MPIGAEKAALMAAAGVASGNYFGDGSLGNCQFGASSITQTSDSVAIDTVLAVGSEAGGPGTTSYGSEVLNPTACYEFTVLNKSGSYDGDMVVANFKDLTIDASVTLTTDQPGRGILVYVDGDCTINGALSMSCRGGFSDPTASGGSDSSAVSATGIRLPLLTASGTDTLSAADFAGAGDAAVAAVANQPEISGDGTIFTISRNGTAGGTYGGSAPSNGTTGAKTISTAGAGCGGAGSGNNVAGGAGGLAGVFGGGSGGGGGQGTTGEAGVAYGGKGGDGLTGNPYSSRAGGGNPGGTGYGGSQPRDGGNGTGGLIILLVNGDLTIASGASLIAKASHGGYVSGGSDASGGGAGGGAIFGLYSGTFSNSGSINVDGGYTNGAYGSRVGADGGHYEAQIS